MSVEVKIPREAINLYNELVPVLSKYTDGDMVWAFGLAMGMACGVLDHALLELAIIAKSAKTLQEEIL